MRLLLSFKELSPGTQIFLLILLILLCGIMSLAIAYLVSMAIWGREVLLSTGDLADMDLNFMRLSQIVNQIGFFVIPPLLLARLTENAPRQFLGFRKPNIRHILVTILLMAVAGPFIGAMIEWNESLSLPDWLSGIEQWMRNSEDVANRLTEKFLAITGLSGLAINILMIGILPAIGEELLFRSTFIGILRKKFKGIHLPVILSAVIFSALHMQFFGFFPRLALGLAFGYLFVWSGSIWIPVLAHFINNATVVVASYLFAKGYITTGADDLGKSDSTFLILASTMAVVFLLYSVYRTRFKETAIVPDRSEIYTEIDTPHDSHV